MNKMLTYQPEPFPELDPETGEIGLDTMTGERTTNHTGEYEFDAIGGEWESEDFEEEYGRRRSPRMSRRAPRYPVKKSVLRRSAHPRLSASRLKPQVKLPKLAPRPLPIPAFRPMAIPFVPPLWVLRPDDYGRPDQNGPASSGAPSPAEPGGEPPSEHVRWIQDCLNRALGTSLVLDGVMGRETRSAVRMFQEKQGLIINGLVGPETEAALKTACASTSAPTPAQGAASIAVNESEMMYATPSTSTLCNRRTDMNYELSFRPEPFGETPEFKEFNALEYETLDPWHVETEQGGPQTIRRMQEYLNKVLGLRLPMDGIMGPQTRSALRTYEKEVKEGHRGQGKVDTRGFSNPNVIHRDHSTEREFPGGNPCLDNCWRNFNRCTTYSRTGGLECLSKLSSCKNFCSPPPPMPPPWVPPDPPQPHLCPRRPTLRLGARGGSVMELQQRLNMHGAKPPLIVDGIFGPKTNAAVLVFQRHRGLVVDGVVGSQTWGALGC